MAFRVISLRRPALLVAGLLALNLGCENNDGIRQYSVPKAADSGAIDASMPAPGRNVAWFFKLTGPQDQVLTEIVAFTEVIRSLQIGEDGRPRYSVPKGWTESSGPAPRYSTLTKVGSDPLLEISISSLPLPASDMNGYLMANTNRWRGQLGLEPLSGDDWMQTAQQNGELVVVPSESRTVAMLNLTGSTEEYDKTRMLAAMVLPPEDDPSMASPEEGLPETEPLSYTVPEGWKKSQGNAMRLASFAVPHESGAADISVTRFPGGGDLLANVNRWRGQVGLKDISAEELKETTQQMTVSGNEATYVEAIGSKDGILAAIVPDGDAKWFFKMQGSKDVLDAEREHFKAFLKSVTLKSPE